MKSGKKNKKHQSPKADRTTPHGGLQEQEMPASPGKVSSKPGFLSRFLSSKSTPQEPPPLASPPTGRITPELSERRESSEKQKSRDSSPKSISIGLASSTYRNLSQSWTDLAAITSRSKPSSPDIEPIAPPPMSPRSIHAESPPTEKPALLPFRSDTIQRQGWLNKRPESDLKRSKSGVPAVWKLQRAVIHDSRLYLYNPPSSLGIKAFSPTPAAPDTTQIPPSTSHIKHSHSPSEGLASQTSAGRVNRDDVGRRPSTAPQAIVQGIPHYLLADSTEDEEEVDSKVAPEHSSIAPRLDDEHRIVGGNVTAICNHILSSDKSGESEIDEDGRIFCTTVGFWAPVEVVLVEMTRIAARVDVRVRLEAIIRFWCEKTPRILWEDGANDALLTLIEEGVTRIDIAKGHSLQNYVVEAEKKFKHRFHPFSEISVDPLQSDIDSSGLADQGLTGNVLLRLSSEVIAEQLYLFHLKYLSAVDPADDMSLLLDRSASHRSRSPLVFSQQSPHFLTRLVYTHVLGLDGQDAANDVLMRAKFLTRWIDIGQNLKARGDLAGFLAIATALLSMPILRLKETWTDVDSELRSMIIRDWSPMMKELHRRELGAEVGAWTAHVLTPDLKREELDSHHVIPYYGDICTALEGFDIWAVTPDTEVDFVQVREVFSAVEHAITRWITFKEEAGGPREPLEKYFTNRSKALQTCFEELHTNFGDGFPYSAEQLFDASIHAEPPPQGAYIEHHYAKRLSVTSGSYVPLMLIDVLPSYKLFEQTDLLEALSTVDKRIMYGTQTLSRQQRERPMSPSSAAWTGRGNKPSPLRRTNSYPPARTSLATTGNPDLDYSTHNRIAGLTSRHFPMLKILRDIAGVEQSLLHVQDGELVLKVVTDTKRLSRPGSAMIETSSKRASLASKRSSAQILGTPSIPTPPPGKLGPNVRNSFHPEFSTMTVMDVVTKAGSLDRLVDVLVLGIEDFASYLLEDNNDTTAKKSARLQMNLDEFRTTFLATFRSFCSPTVLLEYLRKRFTGAVYVAAHINEDENSEDFSESFPDWTPIEPLDNDKVDWQLVGKIQCGVLDTISVWISQYFADFLNTPNLGMELIRFLGVVQQELSAWEEIQKTKPYVSYFSHQIGSMSKGIRKAFAITFYRPSYYSSSFRTPIHFIFMPTVPLTLVQKRSDQFCVLFNELDESLLQLYQQVSIEDWMAAFELFEMQSTDICGFYNPNTSVPVKDDDLKLRTIFTIISQIQRPRSRGSLLLALPKSLRQLHRLHENLVAWVIAQLSDTSVGKNERAARIQSLVAFLRSSRQRMSYLDFYTTNDPSMRLSEERGESRLGVPSFIASAVATALVSPESRSFVGSWAKVFEEEGASEVVKPQGYDTLAEFVHRKTAAVDTGVTRTLTPCLGWIMERMLEIACYVPNMSLESTRLINFDKRRYIFNLLSNIVPASDDLDIFEPIEQSLSPNSFAMQLIASDLLGRRMDLKAIREVAANEADQHDLKFAKVFRSLVADEQRKNRRDQRRRTEIEKQIRDHQKSRPLGVREAPSQPDLREAARSGRDAHRARGAKGMLMRTIRPLSIAISSNPFGDKAEAKIVKAEDLPKTMSIPPGTRASQKLSLGGASIFSRVSYDKEYVFSIKTEEGQECWLQGIDAKDTAGWVTLLTEIAASARPSRHKRDDRPKEVIPEVPKIVKAERFGVKLDIVLEREGRKIPWVVDKLIDDIERRGLDEVGLYRVPGSVSSVKALTAALNTGEDVDMDDPRWIDINVVAGTFKSWLRELPESILTPELYDKFLLAVALQDYEEKYYAIKGLVHQLPQSNFDLLKRVIFHLKRVADNEPINHMNAPNLAICVAPVIVTATGAGNASFAGTMESMGRAQSLVRDLILQCEWIFEKDQGGAKEEDTTEGVEKEDGSGAGDPEESLEIQPVASI